MTSTPNANAHNAALLAAAKAVDHDGVLRALDAGANPNAKDNKLNSALHFLLQNVTDPKDPKLALARLLIERGAHPDSQDRHGQTPLDVCGYGGARDELKAWIAARPEPPEPASPFREWHAQEAEHFANFLDLYDGDKKLDDEPLGEGGAYATTMRDEGGDALLDFHTIYLSPYCFVSERLKDFLQAKAGVALGFIPLVIRDRKNQPVPSAHFLLDPPVVDCLDVEKSDPVLNAGGGVKDVRQLVIDEARVPAAAQVFRVNAYPRIVIVREAFTAALAAAGFEGLDFKPLRR